MYTKVLNQNKFLLVTDKYFEICDVWRKSSIRFPKHYFEQLAIHIYAIMGHLSEDLTTEPPINIIQADNYEIVVHYYDYGGVNVVRFRNGDVITGLTKPTFLKMFYGEKWIE